MAGQQTIKFIFEKKWARLAKLCGFIIMSCLCILPNPIKSHIETNIFYLNECCKMDNIPGIIYYPSNFNILRVYPTGLKFRDYPSNQGFRNGPECTTISSVN